MGKKNKRKKKEKVRVSEERTLEDDDICVSQKDDAAADGLPETGGSAEVETGEGRNTELTEAAAVGTGDDAFVVAAVSPPSPWSAEYLRRGKGSDGGGGGGGGDGEGDDNDDDEGEMNLCTSLSPLPNPTLSEIGRSLARGVLERMAHGKKGNRHRDIVAEPTPIQQRLWPSLLESLSSTTATSRHSDPIGVVGIAPTGSGKTIAYVLPVMASCVRWAMTAAANDSATTTRVRGLIIAPTRELASQISRETRKAAKVANGMLYRSAKRGRSGGEDAVAGVGDGDGARIETAALYGGGADAAAQIAFLRNGDDGKGKGGNGGAGEGRRRRPASFRALIVAATPGRLLDLLKRKIDGDVVEGDTGGGDGNESVASLFRDLDAIILDEADRLAGNSDLATQVDEILALLKEEREKPYFNDGVVSEESARGSKAKRDPSVCLVSATLPEKAREKCNEWLGGGVGRSRIEVRVGTTAGTETAGEKTSSRKDGCGDGRDADLKKGQGDEVELDAAAERTKEHKPEEEKSGEKCAASDATVALREDLAMIPPHVVQTLHVCSSHKKPKKLITTLRKIYGSGSKGGGGRGRSVQRLCIVFFSRIKTLRFASKLLEKEGMKHQELYGTLGQEFREKRLLDFKAGKIPVLLSTDVAARGIHVSGVHYVVNYDFPGSLEQYVHRCGRAGRKRAVAAPEGKGEPSAVDNGGDSPPTVYSFFTREFAPMAASVVELLRRNGADVDPNLVELAAKSTGKGDGGGEGGSAGGTGKKRKRKQKRPSPSAPVGKESVDGGGDASEEDDPFSFLSGKRIVLKRASHVSDAEESDDESD